MKEIIVKYRLDNSVVVSGHKTAGPVNVKIFKGKKHKRAYLKIKEGSFFYSSVLFISVREVPDEERTESQP